MLRSMFSGVAGLRAHQQMVDVTGNNIANVNTTGFRASRVQFADVLSQTARAGAAGTGAVGSTNPTQVGLGVRVASVDATNTPGSLQNTGRAGDLALQGDGYFLLRSGTAQMFSRAGSFDFDNQGRLVDPSGGIVQGWMADANGKVNTNGPLKDLIAGPGMVSPPKATSSVTMAGNLPSQAAVGDKFNTTIEVYDTLGAAHAIQFTMEKTADNTWTQSATDPSGAPMVPASVTLTFDSATGQLASSVPAPNYSYTPSGAPAISFATGYGVAGTAGAITQFGGESTMAATEQDGQANGFLRSVGVANGGMIIGTFSNGAQRVIGQLAVGQVANPNGLEKIGDNHYRLSPAAGNLTLGPAGAAGRAEIVAGALEASNVDLSQEFTNLIIAQRGFQANSRVITTSDEILGDLVQLKR